MNNTLTESTIIKLEMPISSKSIKLPKAVNNRLQQLLDKQDNGENLSQAEKDEAQGLVDLAELLSLLKLRSERIWRESQ